MARIISKVDVVNEIKAVTAKLENNNEKDAEKAGIELIFTLLGKASTKEIEKEIYAFLADVFEVKVEDLRHMKMKQFEELIQAADFGEWKDFFIRVVRFIRSQSR